MVRKQGSRHELIAFVFGTLRCSYIHIYVMLRFKLWRSRGRNSLNKYKFIFQSSFYLGFPFWLLKLLNKKLVSLKEMKSMIKSFLTWHEYMYIIYIISFTSLTIHPWLQSHHKPLINWKTQVEYRKLTHLTNNSI